MSGAVARTLTSLCLLLLLACAVPQERPSVILISLDTLRADRLGAYGNERGLSPHLDRFAESAVVFERAYAQANTTSLSHGSLLGGRYPSELGPAQDFRPSESHLQIGEILQLYDYQTACVTAGGYLRERTGVLRGCQTYETPVDWGSLFHTAPAALDWLDKRDAQAPFFLFLHSYDTHSPYLKPTPFGLAHADADYRGPAEQVLRDKQGSLLLFDGVYYPKSPLRSLVDLRLPRLRGAEERAALQWRALGGELVGYPLEQAGLDHVRAAYDGAVSYVDAHFGALLDQLRRRGLLETTIVAVISDHGESLGEDGVFRHNMTLSDATLHVPLLIRLPGGQGGGQRVQQLVGLLDLMPTLLELAQVPAPAGLPGRSLAPLLRGGQPIAPRQVIFSEGRFRMLSARSAEHRLVFSGLEYRSPYLEPLLASARLDGPAFQGDTQDPAAQAALRDAMLLWRRQLALSQEDGVPLDDALRENLREHGYWGEQ